MTAFSSGELLTAAKLNAFVTPAAWTAFTPAWTSLTVGNGVEDHSYFRAGNLIIARYKLTFGSTTAITGTPNPALPVAGSAKITRMGGCVAEYRDASLPGSFMGACIIASATSAFFLKFNVAGATDQLSGVTATTPFTWAVNDVMSGTVIYEAA